VIREDNKKPIGLDIIDIPSKITFHFSKKPYSGLLSTIQVQGFVYPHLECGENVANHSVIIAGISSWVEGKKLVSSLGSMIFLPRLDKSGTESH
jgi:hypothetical protein